MTAAAVPGHDALLPRPPGGNGAGAALAVLVHAGLLLALTHAVDWRVQTPDVVSAELWASVPQIAAPRAEAPAPAPPAPSPVPPPPAPAPPTPAPAPPPRAEARPDADIATERAERRKAEEDAKRAAETERRRLEAERAAAAAAERRRADAEKQRLAEQQRQREATEKARREAEAEKQRQAEEQRLARQREENLRRIIGQAGGATGSSATAAGSGGSGDATRSAAPSAAYAGLVVATIRPNIVYTRTLADNSAAEVEVRTAPGGTILSRRLVKSSGHPDWDEAVLRAIDRTPSLPRDRDGRVPATLLIAFRPNE